MLAADHNDPGGQHPLHCAFLRNVMVGRKGLSREVLVEAFEEAGAVRVRSFLATGNVVFRPVDAPAAEVIRRVSATLETEIGLQELIFVRSFPALRALQGRQPFADIDPRSVHERCVSFLPPHTPPLPALPLASTRGDALLLAATGSEVFSVNTLVSGRPGAPNLLIERLTEVKVSTRNWNTVERLLALE